MKMRKHFFLALLLAFSALAANFVAMNYAAHSIRLFNDAMSSPAELARIQPERASLSQHVYVALYFGVACAVASIVFAYLSYRVRERAPKFVIFVLLFFYGLFFFARV